ncbi:hypothetical protein OG417_21090 [Actinoallomurus sp. NBC_01490]|jgi:hypothetical protein|uniref:hypothetical protein n=1 Tax=Actinoallomurus sp. NBC_01490 TaxID=2903557 RepID=UPI002E2F3591|nr:hypothetical protein [Actinoallomurus sp. NBC_01490]
MIEPSATRRCTIQGRKMIRPRPAGASAAIDSAGSLKQAKKTNFAVCVGLYVKPLPCQGVRLGECELDL